MHGRQARTSTRRKIQRHIINSRSSRKAHTINHRKSGSDVQEGSALSALSVLPCGSNLNASHIQRRHEDRRETALPTGQAGDVWPAPESRCKQQSSASQISICFLWHFIRPFAASEESQCQNIVEPILVLPWDPLCLSSLIPHPCLSTRELPGEACVLHMRVIRLSCPRQQSMRPTNQNQRIT